MKKSRGITLLELIVVIGIMAVLIGATMFRVGQTSEENSYNQGASLLKTVLNEAKEKAQSPQPSNLITEESDINGYGILVVRAEEDSQLRTREFSLFKDANDNYNPENENRWVDPATTANDDEIIKTYSFDDQEIFVDYYLTSIWESSDGSGWLSVGDTEFSITFKTVQNSNNANVFCDPDLDGEQPGFMRFSLGDKFDFERREIEIDLSSGDIAINYDPS